MPLKMVWADGVLYQASWSSLLSSPAEGGVQQALVSDADASGLWIEGDHVLYSHVNQLFSIPRVGGDSTLMLDGGTTPDPRSTSGHMLLVGGDTLLDENHFYWTAVPIDNRSTFVQRMPRSGGAVETVAELPLVMVEGLALVADGMLAAGFDGSGRSVVVAPLGGGPVRTAVWSTSHGPFVSVDSSGAVWRETAPDNTFLIAPPDGAPVTPLVRGLSGVAFWDWVSPDEGGVRYLGAIETFDDGQLRRSVFSLGKDGSLARLACDPVPGISHIVAMALSPDDLYLTIGVGGGDWFIAKVPRQTRP
jgi:hypothetical protein